VSDLKTLKDIYWNLAIGAWGKETDVLNKEILRQEAIKWIKEFRNSKYLGDGQYLLKNGEFYYIDTFLEHFFNIEESEIKNG